MQLYLVRHGIAEGLGAALSDRARALTPAGMQRIEGQAHALRGSGCAVQRLFCSPYIRARQTAELLAPALDVAVEVVPALQPGCTIATLEQILAPHMHEAGVMVVGHQPFVGDVVYLLTGAAAAVPPGTIAVVEVRHLKPGMGRLVGLYNPASMARLGWWSHTRRDTDA